MPNSDASASPAPSARGSFARKFLRATFGLLAVAVVLSGAILWLFNRAFTTEASVLRASRLTEGNAIFPVQATVLPDRFSRYKPRLFGHTEDSIPINQIASVRVLAGVAFADVVIDTTGGSPPFVVHGLWKGDAETLKDRLTKARNAGKPATPPVTAARPTN